MLLYHHIAKIGVMVKGRA